MRTKNLNFKEKQKLLSFDLHLNVVLCISLEHPPPPKKKDTKSFHH